MSEKMARDMIRDLGILVVDHNAFMRRTTRMMLLNLGAKQVYEACDGLAALEVVRTADPDVILLERDVPVLTGPELLRILRSPELFPRPDIPVIMLSNGPRTWQVMEALRLGAHELLVKPTSPKQLQDRLLAVTLRPRPMVKIGAHYVPEPRRQLAAAVC
jgi:two-component system chemotaxis response regulator CheY